MFFPIPLALKYATARTMPPLANAALIVLNVLFYLWGCQRPAGPGAELSSIFFYGFCHLGFWHLVLNMWVLWVFGNPVNRRLGNGLYLLVYLGCLLAVGLVARILLPIGLVGSSGAIFAILAIALMLMPSALIETAYLAIFPLTILLAVWQPPKYGLNWFLSWGICTVTAWWGLVLIPLVELFSVFWRLWFDGWMCCWTPLAHLLGLLCGVAAVLLLPEKITVRRAFRQLLNFVSSDQENKGEWDGSIQTHFRHCFGQPQRANRGPGRPGKDAQTGRPRDGGNNPRGDQPDRQGDGRRNDPFPRAGTEPRPAAAMAGARESAVASGDDDLARKALGRKTSTRSWSRRSRTSSGRAGRQRSLRRQWPP